jgi:hypothetical protein
MLILDSIKNLSFTVRIISMQNFRSKIGGIKNRVGGYSDRVRNRFENYSYEALDKAAYQAEAAKITLWTASSALSTNLTDFAVSGIINVAGVGDTLYGYDLRKNRPDSLPNYLSKKKVSSTIMVVGGSLFLTAAVLDALSGRLERLPYDVASTAAAYTQALSDVLHHRADSKKI